MTSTTIGLMRANSAPVTDYGSYTPPYSPSLSPSYIPPAGGPMPELRLPVAQSAPVDVQRRKEMALHIHTLVNAASAASASTVARPSPLLGRITPVSESPVPMSALELLAMQSRATIAACLKTLTEKSKALDEADKDYAAFLTKNPAERLRLEMWTLYSHLFASELKERRVGERLDTEEPTIPGALHLKTGIKFSDN